MPYTHLSLRERRPTAFGPERGEFALALRSFPEVAGGSYPGRRSESYATT
jgi:hypothetical protein